MNTKSIHRTIFLIFLVASFLYCGCSDNNTTQSQNTRHIDLEGQDNFRDLGGYNTIYGESIRWGILFRSGDLYDLTDTDLVKVNDLDLKLIIDFRVQGEIDERPDRTPSGAGTLIDSIAVEGFADLLHYVMMTGDTSDLTVSNIAEIFRYFYSDYSDQYKLMLTEVMNSKNLPVLIHCRGGKDRTGFGSALILALLDVPDEVIFEDYLLSNRYLQETTQEALDYFKKSVEHNTGNTPTKEDMQRFRNIAEVRREYLEGAFREVVAQYGTFEKYIIDGLKISEYEIEEFRSFVLVYFG
jgi:protein-tyrosine phosphatase